MELKYFTDASFDEKQKLAKIAYFNKTRNVKQSQVVKCETICQAELKAIELAIENTRSKANKKYESIVIKNDNQSAINKSIEKYSTSHKNIKFEWIPREQNKIADELTKGKIKAPKQKAKTQKSKTDKLDSIIQSIESKINELKKEIKALKKS